MIRIVTDSTASLPRELTESRNIDVLSLFVRFDGTDYEEATLDVDDFYGKIDQMIDNPPKSSQPSAATVQEYFEDVAKSGDVVIGVFMSSAMSGTFEGAVRAATAVGVSRPSFQYVLIDSLSNCFDEGFAVLAAADARDEGASLYQCALAAADAVGRSRFLFAPESLSYLRAGGRIGSAAALIGNLVKLTPVLTVVDGGTSTFAKVRTQKKAADRILQQLEEDMHDSPLIDAVVHYIGDSAPAEKWAREKVEPLIGHEVRVLPASPVIGAHVGPSYGIAYVCEKPLKGKLEKKTPEMVKSLAVKVMRPYGYALVKAKKVADFVKLIKR